MSKSLAVLAVISCSVSIAVNLVTLPDHPILSAVFIGICFPLALINAKYAISE